MEKKRSISYQETYKKNTIATNKQQIVDLIKRNDTTLFVTKAGKYEDGKEFIAIIIDNI